MDLTSRIFTDFKYQPNATTIATPLHEVFLQKSGVCQDFSHFQIACLRSLGIPARYVSGYLLTTPNPDKPNLIGSDASHAWIQVYYPRIGWFELTKCSMSANKTEVCIDIMDFSWGVIRPVSFIFERWFILFCNEFN